MNLPTKHEQYNHNGWMICSRTCPRCALNEVVQFLNVKIDDTRFGYIDPSDITEWTNEQMQGAEAAYKYLLSILREEK